MNKEYNVKRFADRASWLSERRKGVGASEAGVILSVSKYNTPYKLWRLKVGLDEPIEENWAMKQGHYYEQMVADDFETKMGFKVIKSSVGDWLAIDKQRPYLRVSPDRTFWLNGVKHTAENKGLLECKSSRLDLEPDCLQNEHKDWFCQLQYQLYVMRLKYGYLGYVNVETGKEWFEFVEFDKDFCENILIPAIDSFWVDHVVPAQLAITNIKSDVDIDSLAPDDISSEDTILRYPKENSGATLNATEDIIEQYNQYCIRRNEIKNLESQQEVFEESMKMVMCNYESINVENKPIITWKANKATKKFDANLFKSADPTTYNKYLVEKEGARIFRVK